MSASRDQASGAYAEVFSPPTELFSANKSGNRASRPERGNLRRASEIAAQTYLAAWQEPDAAVRARESLMHVLLNHSDFVTVR